MILQFFKTVTWLAEALFAVFDGFRWTIANAGHALRTVIAPDRAAVWQRDVIHRAELLAFSAADTSGACSKGLRLHKQWIEDRIHRAAHKAVIEVFARRRKHLTRTDRGNGAVGERLCPGDDLPRLLDLRGVEQFSGMTICAVPI